MNEQSKILEQNENIQEFLKTQKIFNLNKSKAEIKDNKENVNSENIKANEMKEDKAINDSNCYTINATRMNGLSNAIYLVEVMKKNESKAQFKFVYRQFGQISYCTLWTCLYQIIKVDMTHPSVP